MKAYIIGIKENYLTIFDSEEQARKESEDFWMVVIAANEHAAKEKYRKEIKKFKNSILG